jgi:hypothetical protein
MKKKIERKKILKMGALVILGMLVVIGLTTAVYGHAPGQITWDVGGNAFAGGTTQTLGATTNDDVSIVAGNTQGVIIDGTTSPGFVGIGLAPGTLPANPLDVAGELVVGSGIAGTYVASTNGLAVQGEVFIGATGGGGGGPSTTKLYIIGTGTTSASASLRIDDFSGITEFTVLDNGYVGIGPMTPGSRLEVDGPIEIDSMRFIQGEEHYGNVGNNHYFELLTAQHSGQWDEYEIWGNVICRRADLAQAAYMPFVLTVKQQGPTTSTEPTIQLKYWCHGALSGAQLLARRTSASGAATKTIKLYVLAPITWPTLNWEYHYNDNFFTIDQSPNDVGTSTPSGVAPNYFGNELFAIDGGNVGIGTTTPGSKLSIVGLPTSASGLTTGDLYTQTATQLGGTGTTKVVCIM